jgi:Ca2+-binding EF-hand superfamily protein
MNRHALYLASALAVASLATVALAQTRPAGDKAPRGHMAQLDANGDGAIDRAEAASMPRLAERFDQLDRNKDGRLDKSERPRHRMGRHGGRHGGIARLDVDKDGRISRGEAAAAGDRGKQKLLEQFSAIDADKDGYLVRGELRAYHERMRPQREAERAKRFDAKFAEADLNRDGKLSRIEVDEKMPRLAERFNWMDDNRDGFLGRDELRMKHDRR